MPNPTLIFAPGAWFPTTAFAPLIDKLTLEHPCATIAFPSIQQATNVHNLAPDIAAVRDLVEPLVHAGKEIVLVVHSWAGLPVNSALEGLSAAHRARDGKTGGVVKICFIAAFVPVVGESVLDAVADVPEWWVVDDENKTVTTSDPLGLFFHDVPDGAQWVRELRPHAWATKVAPAQAEAFMHIPSSYLLCEDDRALPLAIQEAMVERMREMGAVVETERIETAHTPWLVRPEQVADYIRRHACIG
ncbi:alpha/beta-hydrolase [Aspergillus floccosus]